MTHEEVKKLVMVMFAAYPNMKVDQEKARNTIDAWEMMLSDYDYSAVGFALKSFIATDTSGFPPTIGQILGKLQATVEKASGEAISDMEAWGMVRKALENGIYGSEKEFARLPELVQKAVGSPEQLYVWATDGQYNEGVAQSQFLRTYRTEVQRDKEFMRLPENMRNLLKGATESERAGIGVAGSTL